MPVFLFWRIISINRCQLNFDWYKKLDHLCHGLITLIRITSALLALVSRQNLVCLTCFVVPHWFHSFLRKKLAQTMYHYLCENIHVFHFRLIGKTLWKLCEKNIWFLLTCYIERYPVSIFDSPQVNCLCVVIATRIPF